MNSHTYNYIILLCSQGASILLGIINLTLVARFLEPAGLGKWSMTVAAATLLFSVFLNWLPWANLRFGREEFVKDGVFSKTWAVEWPMLVFGIFIIVCLLILQPFAWFNRIFQIEAYWWPLILLQVISMYIAAEVQSLLQVTGKMVRYAVVPVIVIGLSTAFVGVLFWFKSLMINRIVFIILGLSAINMIVYGWCWIKEFRQTRSIIMLPDKENVRKIVIYAWPLLPSYLLNYVSSWGNQVLLQTYFTSHDVGLFQAAFKVMSSIMGLSFPVTQIITPLIIGKNALDNSVVYRYISKVVPTIISIWGFLIIPIVVILPSLFLLVMGNKFKEAVPMLLVMIISIPATIIGSLYTVLFPLHYRLSILLIVNGITTFVGILISFILLPVIGPIGAAFGLSISSFVGYYMYISDQHRFLKIPSGNIWLLFGLLIISGCCQAVVGSNMVSRALFLVAALAVFIYMIRRYSVVSSEILGQIFQGRLAKVGSFIQGVLIK